MLRTWQASCVDKALRKYSSGQRHFLCLATPGAGKTIMASEVAAQLKKEDLIDLVLCFSPSLSVAEGIKNTFSWRMDCAFNGGLGAVGGSYTYQNMMYMEDTFWHTLQKFRVLVVFDEIHHCAGSNQHDANSWGLEILTKILDHAAYTLALTGTPWRSDSIPITLAQYADPDGQIQCDYIYGLKEAVSNGVCRSPKIVLVDNDRLTFSNENEETKTFNSISELLQNESIPYQTIITNKDTMMYLLRLGCLKLNSIRRYNPNAGGLVVASSVAHAREMLSLLINEFNQSAVIVTYQHEDPVAEIARFRTSNIQWIVSVGMVSEGTDIPRLQVCCHLSHVKTELYFRQVLGRILRVNDTANQEAWLYTIAESKLSQFAERISDDLPGDNTIIKLHRFDEQGTLLLNDDRKSIQQSRNIKGTNKKAEMVLNIDWETDLNVSERSQSEETLTLGTFRQRLVSAFLL